MPFAVTIAVAPAAGTVIGAIIRDRLKTLRPAATAINLSALIWPLLEQTRPTAPGLHEAGDGAEGARFWLTPFPALPHPHAAPAIHRSSPRGSPRVGDDSLKWPRCDGLNWPHSRLAGAAMTA